jgi:hypothetical protein
MTLLDNWRALLVPSGTFQLQDLWQLIIVIALFTISTKTFGAKANSVVITHCGSRAISAFSPYGLP